MVEPVSCDEIFKKNLKLQQREIRENKIKLESVPTRMIILFGNRCNLRCKMCGNRGLLTRVGIKKTSKLSKEVLSVIISYFPSVKKRTVYIIL